MANTIQTNEGIYDLNDAMLNVIKLTPAQRKYRNSGKAFSAEHNCDVCGKPIKNVAKATRIVARAEDDSFLELGPTCATKWTQPILEEIASWTKEQI